MTGPHEATGTETATAIVTVSGTATAKESVTETVSESESENGNGTEDATAREIANGSVSASGTSSQNSASPPPSPSRRRRRQAPPVPLLARPSIETQTQAPHRPPASSGTAWAAATSLEEAGRRSPCPSLRRRRLVSLAGCRHDTIFLLPRQQGGANRRQAIRALAQVQAVDGTSRGSTSGLD